MDPTNRATIARNISISSTPAPLQTPTPIIPKLTTVPAPAPAPTQQASPRTQVPTSTLTPIPESSGHGSGGGVVGDDAMFNKYRTMVKNKSPVGIVRLQMKKDGFSPAEIDACFGANPTAAPSKPTLSPAPKASVPAAASPPPTASAPPVPAAVAGEEDTYKKYRTMLKLNLPEGAIRQKMRTDGISPTIIDIFINSGGTVPPPPSAPSAAQAVATPVSPPAEAAEDPMKKYRTMLKLNLPEGAIRQKMKADGFAFSVIDAFIKTNGAITTPAAAVVDDKLKAAVTNPVLRPPNTPAPIAPQPTTHGADTSHIPDHIDAYPYHQASALDNGYSNSDKTSLPDEDDEDLSDDEGMQSMTAVRSVQTVSPLPLPRPRRKADGRIPITASKSDYNKANAAFFAGIVEVCIYRPIDAS